MLRKVIHLEPLRFNILCMTLPPDRNTSLQLSQLFLERLWRISPVVDISKLSPFASSRPHPVWFKSHQQPRSAQSLRRDFWAPRIWQQSSLFYAFKRPYESLLPLSSLTHWCSLTLSMSSFWPLTARWTVRLWSAIPSPCPFPLTRTSTQSTSLACESLLPNASITLMDGKNESSIQTAPFRNYSRRSTLGPHDSLTPLILDSATNLASATFCARFPPQL